MRPSSEQLMVSPVLAMPKWLSSMNVEIFGLGDSENDPVQLPPDPGPVQIPSTPDDPPEPGAPGEPIPDAPDPPNPDPIAPVEPPSPDTGGGDSSSGDSGSDDTN
jgi:hypothetical protein